jgi:superfamily II DNA or RNA helicase
MQLIVSNSFTTISGNIPKEAKDLLTEVLTYRNDIDAEKAACFYRMQNAKRYNNLKGYNIAKARIAYLEKTEYVCLIKDNKFPTGLLNIVKATLEEVCTPFEVQDRREIPSSSQILRWNNKPFEPRYYQKEMIRLGLEAGRGVFSSCVGSGKTCILAYLIKELAVTNLIIVPSRGLSLQLYSDFEEWFGSTNVEILDAKKIRLNKRPKAINIITVQSLASLQKSGEFQKFALQMEALFIDEAHHSSAESYLTLLPDLDHIYYRFSFSGTYLRQGADILALWGVASNILYEYPAWKATQEGYLTPLEVLVHQIPGRPITKYQKEYEESYSGNPAVLNKILEIIENVELDNQVLILVSQKDKVGLVISEYLTTHGVICSYINGDDSKELINNTINEFNEKLVRILIGSSVIGEGINIKSTDHLINCVGGKSEILCVQNAGRAIRKFEGKSIAYLHDFFFEGTNYLARHLENRLEIYIRNFNCKIKDLRF